MKMFVLLMVILFGTQYTYGGQSRCEPFHVEIKASQERIHRYEQALATNGRNFAELGTRDTYAQLIRNELLAIQINMSVVTSGEYQCKQSEPIRLNLVKHN